MEQENRMGTMPIPKLVVTMSVPLMISMLVQALYNIVDSIFVAKISEDALTAVSLAFPVQNLMISLVVGTGVGINALLSMSLGRKDMDEVKRCAVNGLFLAFCSYLVFVVFGVFCTRLYFSTQTGIQSIIDYGVDYLSICCAVSLGLFGQVTLERLLQATGRTFYTMISHLTGALTNIILDPLLIFGIGPFPEWGVRGAAIATVIGQTFGMLVALGFNIAKNHEIALSFRKFRPNIITIKRIYAVGVPSTVMAAIASVMTYGMNRILMSFSATATAVFGVYFKLQSFMFMPVFGLNNGMVPILSYNYGAKKPERIKETIRVSTIGSTLFMLSGLLLFQLAPGTLLGFFDASDEMLKIGTRALRIISLCFIPAGYIIVRISVFQALGSAFMGLMLSVLRQLIFLLPLAFLLSRTGILDNVWWAFPLADIGAFAYCVIQSRRLFRAKLR